MNAIHTTLTTSGNSVAIRLPKNLLRMSGLGKKVQLEARSGKIVISNLPNIRDGWNNQIKKLLIDNGDPAKEFDDMHASDQDLNNLTWNGPSFEAWQKDHAKLS